ncbi:epoxide hydrolase family protein [Paenibacillus mucilaginosus]|uniref:Epoxide hydrolase-like protein n=1 Tax=Paenibacillus mucilaginosus (strain KNP414) TaxID=1036673 RepID=F8F608_PAEMK|nr:epoxide hydrolase [Paenibacillus mucilaginosus]AEI41896.1 epoxide hydrolase-like protein [Paenibacillus mucilaginosus KNP414]MCG7214566.1 epoxide hydrolase 1 [Paenibacillus mucilaginosus]WDM30843.1 alpha/beta fold hydrolase [Paenibacillus mucilaginosus]
MTTPPFLPEPSPICVSDELLADLEHRLKSTRWPLDAGNDDWFYGVSRKYLEELVDYWIHKFDWRRSERAINAYEHYKVNVDGVPVHFMRKPGRGPNPIPLILSHGWPWTFWHWAKVIDPLADPGAYGGDPSDAFDVIVPSLPGFGFSAPLSHHPDMNFWKMADLWHTLMTDVLGYKKYAAGGCDVGALITGQLGHKYSDELYAIHIGSALKLNFFNGDRAWDFAGGRPIPEGIPEGIRKEMVKFDRRFASHLAVHVLDPGTLAYGLSDSPAGMLAWILERWNHWSDNKGDIEHVFSKDDILTHATIYWVTHTIETSMRTYANNNRYPWAPSHDRWPVVEAPTGITFVGYENPPGITTEHRVRSFLESDRAPWYNHIMITVHEQGGHFIPWEIPEKWVEDLRRTMRGFR